MADKRIDELDAISSLSDDSLFVAEQSGSAGKVTGLQFKNFAKEAAEAYAESAANSATAASESASAASSAASSATAAQSAIENMTVSSKTLATGAAATVTKTETAGVVNLEFGLPRGAKGDKGDTGDTGPRGETGATGETGPRGPAATVTVGTVTTGAAGTAASVTNSGTDTDAVLDFVIPRGADGSGAGDMTSGVYDPAGGKKQVAFESDLTAHTGNNTIHVTAAEKESWSGKQDALTFDSAPTSGSTNPVTSGGMYTALNAKANASALNSHTGNSNIHVTAEEKATWNESDVFVATYNSTTFDEVEAAYNAGKAVLCKSTNTYYFLSIAFVGTAYTFQCVTYSTVDDDDGNTFYLNSAKFLQVKKSGGWSSFTSNYPKKHAAAHAMGGIDEITPVADTNYTTLKLRGQSLNSVDTTPTLNGNIAWTYD